MTYKLITTAIFGVLLLGTSCKSTKKATTEEPMRTEEPVTSRENTNREGPRGNGDRQGPPSIDEVFKMDQDGDGMLSKSEIKGRLAERFDEIDSNRDGLISRKEFENAPKPQRGQRPERKN